LVLAGAALAPVDALKTVFLEQRKEPPRGWSFRGSASPTDSIQLSVALKESDMDELKARLARTSNPNHAEYGNHLTQAEVSAYRKPDRKRTSDVYGWLRSNGIPNARVHDSWISFDASVAVVKSLFQADLAYYSYNGTEPRLRALSYTVPESLRDDIKFVHPLANFMPPRREHHRAHRESPRPSVPGRTRPAATGPAVDMPCFTGTYPECIKQLYNITYNQTAPSPVRFGIGGFLDQYVNYNDVKGFMESYTPELMNLTPPYTFRVELVNNGSNLQEPIWEAGIEASLDVEYSLAIAYPASVTYYSTGGRGEKLNSTGGRISVEESDNEPYFEFLQSLLAKPDATLPHVLSISYADDEQSVPEPYARQVCDMFASLTARGMSIFVATGDGGAVGTGQSQCISNDGEGRKSFIPTFPASCPYVTSVGATDNVGPPVTGAQFSAGGFSSYFWRPDWQDTVVGAYVEKMAMSEDPKMGLFNAAGRAVPDISAVGGGFQIQLGGSVTEVLGTSASTPVVAGMVALVNDARLRAGKNTTGWLNPMLYSANITKTLLDVTKGFSAGCTFPDGTTLDGWEAIVGYDCVTGLGTVGDFNQFLAAFM
ncbi:subtilisin-like protein, partial [Thozetella sp. PMI_491]